MKSLLIFLLIFVVSLIDASPLEVSISQEEHNTSDGVDGASENTSPTMDQDNVLPQQGLRVKRQSGSASQQEAFATIGQILDLLGRGMKPGLLKTIIMPAYDIMISIMNQY